MNKKLTIEESLNKIKFMMNYDSSKTRTDQLSEQIAMAPFAAPAAAAIGAVKTGVSYVRVKRIFDYCAANKDALLQIPRGLNDQQITEASRTLYDAMQGLGTDEEAVYGVLNSLTSLSDLTALLENFNSTYGGKQDLLRWLIGDFKTPFAWKKIEAPILALSDKASKGTTLDIQKPDPIVGPVDNLKPPVDNGGKTAAQYRFVNGTIKDPYKNGTKGSGIAQVQQNLGLTQDGKWGPVTDAKIRELVPEYTNGFTNQDLSTIIGKIHTAANAGINANTANLKTVQPAIGVNTNPSIAQAKPKVQNILNPNPNMNKLRPAQKA